MQGHEEPHPMHVLSLVAGHTVQDLRFATVILVIDGLQCFMTDPNDDYNKDSAFYGTLINIVDLAFEDVFLTTCCTAMAVFNKSTQTIAVQNCTLCDNLFLELDDNVSNDSSLLIVGNVWELESQHLIASEC
ncbi:hypothetical protein EDD21DRAFT_418965 [Dissophora ornata]|nr:hypothetical protein EDD21DRAFT_418965 [Dissophora ornata]